MAHINLLPWRENQRKERQREFIGTAALSSVLMLVIIFYAHIHIGANIDAQSARNEFLEQQIKIVETQIKEISELETQKQQLLARMEIIQKLQASRPEIVHLFSELAHAVPDGVHLTRVVRDGANLTIEGAAQSNARVSTLMRNLDASPFLANPRLVVIDASKQADMRNVFTLTVSQEAGKPAEGQDDQAEAKQ